MKTQRFAGEQAPLMEAPRNPNEPLLPGTEILGGKYVVVRMLGQGGMGFVVAARHKALGRVDAIKFLLPQFVTHGEISKRFEREAQSVANLKSPHVAQVFDFGVTEFGEPYIVMEFLKGRDLKAELRRGPLPIADAVDYVLQACEALIEAHENGIVHRDLKPANLFLAETKNGESCLKVLDFGIAKVIDDDPVTEITAEGGNGGFLGTIPYMSPEHLKTPGKVDQRTDIWSLGVVAYELLTKEKPFNGLTKLDLVSKIIDRDEHPEPPSKYCPALPPAIEMVIGRCLAKDRDARYQTVKEFAAALRQAACIPEPPPMRQKMNSITTESPVELLLAEEAKTQESTQGKTQAAYTMTNPAPSRRSQWAKLGFAGAGAMTMSGVVVGLVLALVGGNEAPGVRKAQAGVGAAVSAVPTPLVPVEPSALAVAQAPRRKAVQLVEVGKGNGAGTGGAVTPGSTQARPDEASVRRASTVTPTSSVMTPQKPPTGTEKKKESSETNRKALPSEAPAELPPDPWN
jgi:serine/threonine protein kinase